MNTTDQNTLFCFAIKLITETDVVPLIYPEITVNMHVCKQLFLSHNSAGPQLSIILCIIYLFLFASLAPKTVVSSALLNQSVIHSELVARLKHQILI